MEWQTPADEHWANNCTVTGHARIEKGRIVMRYTAMHLPTMHEERAVRRDDAMRRLRAWVAKQTPPSKPDATAPYGAEARSEAIRARIKGVAGTCEVASE